MREATRENTSKLKIAISKGLQFIFDSQYKSGGWPLAYPLRKTYTDLATFNDDSHINIMIFLKEMQTKEFSGLFTVKELKSAKQKFGLGLNFIQNSQIRHKGKFQGWAQQYDPETFKPKKGRAYEMVAIATKETVSILDFLSSLEDLDFSFQQQVKQGKEWILSVAIKGIAWGKKTNRGLPIVAEDSRIWARFYEIGSNRAVFSGRDGIIKYSIAKIEVERRTEYSWYGNWGQKLRLSDSRKL